MKKLGKIIFVLILLIILMVLISVASAFHIFKKDIMTDAIAASQMDLLQETSPMYILLEEDTMEKKPIVIYLNQENLTIEEDALDISLPQVNSNEETTTQDASTSESQESNPVPDPEYYIKVNYKANAITIYIKDEAGNYINPVKAFICSTGTATPRSGTYALTNYKKEWVDLQGGVCGQYGWQVVRRYFATFCTIWKKI